MRSRKEKGFTLMEMLIVVAIVAILVAVAIPTFSGALERVRKAADDANLRAAKAVAAVNYMTHGCAVSDCDGSCGNKKAYYDIGQDRFFHIDNYGNLPDGYNLTEQSFSGMNDTLTFPKGTASVVTDGAGGSDASAVFWYGDPRAFVDP